MSDSLIITGNAPIQQPYDPFWDKPITRREVHKYFMRLAANDNELMGMADTASILINFICEKKLGITDRAEVEVYVMAKTEELKARRLAMKVAAAQGADPEQCNPGPQTVQATDAQPNS